MMQINPLCYSTELICPNLRADFLGMGPRFGSLFAGMGPRFELNKIIFIKMIPCTIFQRCCKTGIFIYHFIFLPASDASLTRIVYLA